MTMTDYFAAGYAKKTNITFDTLAMFTKRCRYFGDRIDSKTLQANGVSETEIIAEHQQGLIKYDPNCGQSRRLSGYSLTESGIKLVYEKIKVLTAV